MILLPELLEQICKSRLHPNQEQELDPTDLQRDSELRQLANELKEKDDEICRLNEKKQTDAKKIRNLEQEIWRKDEEVERLNILLDQHTLNSTSEQHQASFVSVKQVFIANVQQFNCMMIGGYEYKYINATSY